MVPWTQVLQSAGRKHDLFHVKLLIWVIVGLVIFITNGAYVLLMFSQEPGLINTVWDPEVCDGTQAYCNNPFNDIEPLPSGHIGGFDMCQPISQKTA